MAINWQRVENRFREIDHATYGLADLVVFGGGGAVVMLSLYCIMSAAVYGYLQLFSLITGAF